MLVYNVQVDTASKRFAKPGNIHGLIAYQFYIDSSITTRDKIIEFFKQKMPMFDKPNYAIYVSYKPIQIEKDNHSFEDIEKEISK